MSPTSGLRGEDRVIYFADSGMDRYNLWEPRPVEKRRPGGRGVAAAPPGASANQ